MEKVNIYTKMGGWVGGGGGSGGRRRKKERKWLVKPVWM